MRRSRKPTLFGAFWTMPVFVMLVAFVIHPIYAPAAVVLAVPGGLACAVSFYLWRLERYHSWLRGDDALEPATTGPSGDVPTTPAT